MSEQTEPPAQPAPQAPLAQPQPPAPFPPLKANLGVISFGLAVGITLAISAFILSLAAAFFDWGTPMVMILSSLYVGFSPTFVGGVAGAVWGFVNGFIFGTLIAWIYNRLISTRR